MGWNHSLCGLLDVGYEKKKWLIKAIDTLSDREKIIIKARKLKDKLVTLEDLGRKLVISKERVRQIETRALDKLKKTILKISQQEKEFFIWSFVNLPYYKF